MNANRSDLDEYLLNYPTSVDKENTLAQKCIQNFAARNLPDEVSVTFK